MTKKNISILIISLTLFSCNNLFKDNITINKRILNGSKKYGGKELHYNYFFKKKHILKCNDTKSASCKWINMPSTPYGNANYLEKTVIRKIKKDSLSGNFKINKLSIKWDAIDSLNYDIEIFW